MNLRYKLLLDNAKYRTVSPEKMVFIPGSRAYAL